MVMEVDGGLGQRRPRGCHQKHPRRSPPEKENMVYLKIALSPSLRKRIEGRKGGRSGGVCQGVGELGDSTGLGKRQCERTRSARAPSWEKKKQREKALLFVHESRCNLHCD
ncbi:Os06g0209200 [Oryza sativa Japonica Group]|uniref:Os06g0209200 protein n=1 Tax=Oryza sativa subsp. japonica TaxID=39947 RepID=A0A0P0WUF0_ORYSJ|nr:Os06g0209200 [Oryza sativa Japonica Group]